MYKQFHSSAQIEKFLAEQKHYEIIKVDWVNHRVYVEWNEEMLATK